MKKRISKLLIIVLAVSLICSFFLMCFQHKYTMHPILPNKYTIQKVFIYSSRQSAFQAEVDEDTRQSANGRSECPYI